MCSAPGTCPAAHSSGSRTSSRYASAGTSAAGTCGTTPPSLIAFLRFGCHSRDDRPAIAGQGTQAVSVMRNARAARRVGPGVIVRDARPDELADIGDLRVAAY